MGANDSPTTTRSIITDYFDWRLNNKTITNNRLFLIVRKIASESETAYYNQQSTFNFNISPTTIIDDQTLNNIKSLHKEIGKELLNEGGITWGRIITFIAFSALLAEHILQQSNNSTRNLIISSIIDWTTEFIDTELQSWLQSQNDWSGFLKLYDKSSQRRSSIGRYASIIGTLGMLTLGALYIRRT